MKCSHLSRVKEWGFTPDHDFVATMFDCVLCGEESPVPFARDEQIDIDHTNCDDDCFGCKARGLQLNTGDAKRDIPDKVWTNELKAYKDARAQGIQPAGTTRAHIEQAYAASETLGKAYDADTMPKAKDISKESVAVMKEIGQI
jgi:hypothetical protein